MGVVFSRAVSTLLSSALDSSHTTANMWCNKLQCNVCNWRTSHGSVSVACQKVKKQAVLNINPIYFTTWASSTEAFTVSPITVQFCSDQSGQTGIDDVLVTFRHNRGYCFQDIGWKLRIFLKPGLFNADAGSPWNWVTTPELMWWIDG